MPRCEIPPENDSSSTSSLISFASGNSDGINVAQLLGSDSNSDSEQQNNLRRFRYEMPVYEPIIIPREPSLDELLQQVSGTSRLDTVTEIRLRVVSHMISLQRIHFFMPNLKVLILDGSHVSSLRDLGCEMHNLRHLNVSRSGLRNLDGLNGFSGLEELVADSNEIEDVSQCCSLSNVKFICLKSNRIRTLDGISFLELCPAIRNLNLIGNPVTQVSQYRTLVKQSIPQLIILDEIEFIETECGGELSSSEYQSSTTTSPDISYSVKDSNVDHCIRSSSAVELKHEAVVIEKNEVNRRPMTATGGSMANTCSELTSGEPLCGNIIQTIRRRRKKIAWGGDSEQSNSSSSESSSLHIQTHQDFPNQLPQKSVPLELGVIGVRSEDRRNNDIDDSCTPQSLLDAAKHWRLTSQKTRETIRHTDNLRVLNEYSSSE